MKDLNCDNSAYSSLLAQSVQLLPKYLRTISQAADKTARKVHAEGADAAGSDLDTLADKLSCLINLFSIVRRDCAQTRDFAGSPNIRASIRQIKIHLLSILKAIKTAKENGDEVMLADLLEYELKDNLTQWKITAIPHIKRLIQTATI
ncbi:MAG: hypothetical protein WEB87_03435 [Bacteriovoracaceae bacterium]